MPVILPVVEVSIDNHGDLAVTVDGEPYEVPDNVVPSGRAALGRVLHELTRTLASPVRVELHEADGSRFTDIVTPAEPAEPEDAGHAGRGPRSSSLPGVTRFGIMLDGFTPGEPVAVAVVVTQATADTDGVAKLRLPAAVLARQPGALVLLGRTSGTVAFSDDPTSGAGHTSAGAAGGRTA